MEFTGRYVIPAPPEAVWAAINDPEILKACIPGCEQMDKTDESHFVAAAKLKIGPVKATFKCNIELSEMDPPRRCVLRGEGQGGMAGFARGEAEVLLANDAGATVLTYAAKATIGGKLAQIGQRLIDGAAKQIADNFFTRFAEVVTAAPARAEAAALAATPPELAPEIVPPPLAENPPETTRPSAKREGLAPEIWVIGLIAVIVILLVLFGLVL